MICSIWQGNTITGCASPVNITTMSAYRSSGLFSRDDHRREFAHDRDVSPTISCMGNRWELTCGSSGGAILKLLMYKGDINPLYPFYGLRQVCHLIVHLRRHEHVVQFWTL